MDKGMDLEEQYDRIYRYCYFKFHHREMAEDITQETFLRFFQRCPEVKKDEALRFLYTVARNLCVDEYRRKQPLFLEDEGGICNMEEERGPDGMEGELLTNAAVRAALLKLEPSDRELLLLRYVNEVPVSVIGKLQGISRFSVRRRLMQAADRFKKYLGEEGVL